MEINGSKLTEPERLELGRLLLKAGYTVQMFKRRPKDKTSGAYNHYIKAEEDHAGR